MTHTIIFSPQLEQERKEIEQEMLAKRVQEALECPTVDEWMELLKLQEKNTE